MEGSSSTNVVMKTLRRLKGQLIASVTLLYTVPSKRAYLHDEPQRSVDSVIPFRGSLTVHADVTQ